MSEEFTLKRISQSEWLLEKSGEMRVPGRIFADIQTIEQLQTDVAEKKEWNALRQVRDVACLPGIVTAALALPDVHPGYGFPIGGVGAFDLKEGVVVVGGVGFDINCGVRLLATPLHKEDLSGVLSELADDLYRTVPAGLGSEGKLRLTLDEIDQLLREGARYVVKRGYGVEEDLVHIEEEGQIPGADPTVVSRLAKQRQFRQVGTLGSGNHYLEVQTVVRIIDPEAAAVYGLEEGQVVTSIHTGSRALGHQIGQDYLKEMEQASRRYQIPIRSRELVCAPILSDEGKRYLSAVACGSNCAFANRQVIAHLVRSSFARILGLAEEKMHTVYDIGHNNVKVEHHLVDGTTRALLVHRKGSTRAFGPGRRESPPAYRAVGHPTLVGGTMGTASYVMRGTNLGMEKAFGSGIHGAGRALSRRKAAKKYWGKDVKSAMAADGIILREHSLRGVAEEAPGAYKDVERVVHAATDAGINQPVACLRPLLVIKG
ncbi:TPA: RNA-splicing ligase RtcB [Candidatus Acetothermia bacterium]|nr:RNA-splicing ligase RtcB [Candidatus Acetothermia bacterium]